MTGSGHATTGGGRAVGAPPRRFGRHRTIDDSGAMTVTTAFAVAAVMALTLAALVIARAAVAGHTARSAADLAALAGAYAVRDGGDACSTASEIASANGAATPVCTVDGDDVVVRAEVRVDLGLFGARSASAVARAGPV